MVIIKLLLDENNRDTLIKVSLLTHLTRRPTKNELVNNKKKTELSMDKKAKAGLNKLNKVVIRIQCMTHLATD